MAFAAARSTVIVVPLVVSKTMSRDPARVYVGDLGSGGSKPELEREFERYGPLKSVWVARNPPGENTRQHCLYRDSKYC